MLCEAGPRPVELEANTWTRMEGGGKTGRGGGGEGGEGGTGGGGGGRGGGVGGGKWEKEVEEDGRRERQKRGRRWKWRHYKIMDKICILNWQHDAMKIQFLYGKLVQMHITEHTCISENSLLVA